MGTSMELAFRQQLTLTPQLQQALRLLQLAALEFEQEVNHALETNPLLEEDGDAQPTYVAASPAEDPGVPEVAPAAAPADEADAARDAEMAAGSYDERPRGSNRDDEDSDWTEWSEAEQSLQEHLRNQLLLSQMGERDRALSHLVIDALDEDGYLRQELDELAQLVPPEYEVEPEEIQAALRLVQTLEPAGIGARSLEECLRLQLHDLPEDTPGLATAREILNGNLALLARREFGKLKKLARCDDAELRAAGALIRTLDPKPGRAFGHDENRYVVPDVVVSQVRGRWVVTVNPAVMPRISINRAYAEVVADRSNAGTMLSQQLQEARWLIRSMEQRFTTIQRVAEAIVMRQRRFLEFGDVAMKPLTMKDIANELGLHESTVCRAVNGKYMATPRGVFEFKRFFSRQLATDSGGSCSAAAVRALLKQLISSEDPRQPLSDARLAQMLGEQGLRVARRTVSKYRNLMRLPNVEMRQSLDHSASG